MTYKINTKTQKSDIPKENATNNTKLQNAHNTKLQHKYNIILKIHKRQNVI